MVAGHQKSSNFTTILNVYTLTRLTRTGPPLPEAEMQWIIDTLPMYCDNQQN